MWAAAGGASDVVWQLPVEQIKKRTWSNDSDAFVFTEGQQIRIAGHHECRAALDSSCDVLVAVRITGERRDLDVAGNEVRQDDDVLEPEFRINFRASGLVNLGIGE